MSEQETAAFGGGSCVWESGLAQGRGNGPQAGAESHFLTREGPNTLAAAGHFVGQKSARKMQEIPAPPSAEALQGPRGNSQGGRQS